jgi:branched-chain amino acid transport system substrate-binding protein
MRNLMKTAAAGIALALAFGAPVIAQDTLTVGILVPTTGSEATYGQDMANAIDLAISEINAKGGVLGKQLASTVGDDACDAQQAVNAASKLASSGVVGIVGGYCSGATIPTLQIFGDAKLPMIIPAANSTKLIPANPGNVFMINSTGNDQVAKAIEYFTAHGIKSIAIVNQGDAYSVDLADLTKKNWEAAGNTVTAFEVTNKGEQDYSAVVTSIKSGNPDAVFWTAYYADGGLLIRQLREAGYQGLIAVGDGSNSPELFKIAGPAAEGVIAFSNPTADFLPDAKAFAEAYQAKYGAAPGPYSTLSYDAMNLLAWAITTAGSTDYDAVVAALQSANFTDTISGPISFTPEKTLARSNFVVLQGAGGAWTLAK